MITARVNRLWLTCFVAGGGALGAMQQASAADSVFTVAKYPIEATASDAVTAKREAMADGQAGSFRALLKRLVPVTAYRHLPRMNPAEIEPMLSGLNVRSEQNSTTEYLATLDFNFDAAAVRRYLRKSGLPYVERQAQPVLILPVYRNPQGIAGRHLEQRTGQRTWREAWAGLDLVNALSPVKLATFKPEIREDVLAALIAGDETVLRIFQQEFGTARIVVAHATPSADGAKIVTTLAGLDAVGIFHLRRSYRIEDNDLFYAAELATIIGLGVMEGRWKAINRAVVSVVSSGPVERVRFVVNFNGLGQWQQIRRRLSELPGATNIDNGTVTTRAAEVSLDFAGGVALFQQQLASEGMYLSNRAGGWVLEVR